MKNTTKYSEENSDGARASVGLGMAFNSRAHVGADRIVPVSPGGTAYTPLSKVAADQLKGKSFSEMLIGYQKHAHPSRTPMQATPSSRGKLLNKFK